MPSTINSTTTGVKVTSDSSGALNIQVGGTNAIEIGANASVVIGNLALPTSLTLTTLNATSASITTLSATSLTVSSPQVFPAGSASAPAVTTTGDTNTGIYFPAADQVAVTTGGTVAAGFNSNGLFFRNRIINGDMRIDQRNAGAAVTVGGAYSVDRFFTVNNTDGAYSAQQDTSVPAGSGFINSVKFTTTTADATLAATQNCHFDQAIEGTNVADLMWGTANARTVTLSFWVRSSLTGTFGGVLRNSAFNRAYPYTYTISAADTWEYKTVTIPGDTTGTWLTTNGIGILVIFGLGAGVNRSGTAGAWNGNANVSATGAVSVIGTLNATWYVTGVQLETGSVATPFERRPYGTELMLCQRYCVLIASGANKPIANSFYYSATNVSGYLSFPVDMRATPTLSVVTGTNYYGNVANGGIDSLNSFTQDLRNERGIALYNNTEASGTAGHGGYFYSQNAAGQVLVTAELV